MINVHLRVVFVFLHLLLSPVAEENLEEHHIKDNTDYSASSWCPSRFLNNSQISVKSISRSLLETTYEYLVLINASTAVFIVPDASDLQTVRCLRNGSIKILILQELSTEVVARMKNSLERRFVHFVLFGDSHMLQELLNTANDIGMFTGDYGWTIVLKDNELLRIPTPVRFLTTLKISDRFECLAPGKCACGRYHSRCSPKELEDVYSKWLSEISTEAVDNFNEIITMKKLPLLLKNYEIEMDIEIEIVIRNMEHSNTVSFWSPSTKFEHTNLVTDDIQHRKLRIAMTYDSPFFMKTNQEGNNKQYIGLSIDVLLQLKNLVGFDYELIISSSNDDFYESENGLWKGIIGQLIAAEVDLVLAPISITVETNEVVDFVKPSFDHRGFSIIARRREKTQSLFKFTKVMGAEVWLGVVASIVVTAIVLWLEEKFGAKSNSNKRALKEWLWYTIISFTGQGGGDVPIMWCGKFLIACYWLFVLLILSAFNANLTALLTTERMYRQINSLQEMIREPEFSYTAVANSSALRYLEIMAEAEEEIADLWEKYSHSVTWEYPVNERYKTVLAAIEKSGLVDSLEEGIGKVKSNKDGNFAIFTTSFTAKYLASKDCDLVIIGETFGDHVYGFAVRKGSSLSDLLTESMLTLQRERFLEETMERYFTKNASCSSTNPDTLSLYELGGTFILASVGLVTAVIAVIGEAYIARKKAWKTTKIYVSRKIMSRKRTTRVRRF